MYKDNKMPLATVVDSIEANSNPSGFWACLIPQRYAPLYYLCLHKNAPSVITLKSVFCFFCLPKSGLGWSLDRLPVCFRDTLTFTSTPNLESQIS